MRCGVGAVYPDPDLHRGTDHLQKVPYVEGAGILHNVHIRAADVVACELHHSRVGLRGPQTLERDEEQEEPRNLSPRLPISPSKVNELHFELCQ